ncbi:FAD-dependent oxidoreductase [Pseudomonas turukhanskensis]|uniref:NAD(P)-binding protein n=1 Tax=Pseudomonas turukhanskensis TaxID=1806536 RepID=A0A9W6K954_9PSED|nr:NAD(P)/FAD-dependent oxidoreductase [Pseudomonas turukhanskensis]GLK91207.1 NAD(P)-binding protein [Pseudomonas turukhanskensis]
MSDNIAAISNGAKGKRIAIIGAGPGGIAAGVALHQAGFAVTVFERNPELRPLGGAIILNATGIVILRSLGVQVDDIFSAGLPEFRRYDGRVRVNFDIDMALMEQAGVTGWQSGMMRSELYKRLLAAAPANLISTSHSFTHYVEKEGVTTVHFAEGQQYECDLVIGADGIQSKVREQLWGASELKHLGIAVWLGWCELQGPERKKIVISHDHAYQMGYAPLRYQDKDCFEWWFVEKCAENQIEPSDPAAYVRERIGHFSYPMPEILAATDTAHNLFRWVVKYREPLKQWSKGRVTIMGDAAHPTSPYAAYGAGMAIEDGFFLAKYLRGRDLSDSAALQAGLQRYDEQRVDYTNQTTAFARFLGRLYHGIPAPLNRLRDLFLDHSSLPAKMISKGVTGEAQALLRAVLEPVD